MEKYDIKASSSPRILFQDNPLDASKCRKIIWHPYYIWASFFVVVIGALTCFFYKVKLILLGCELFYIIYCSIFRSV